MATALNLTFASGQGRHQHLLWLKPGASAGQLAVPALQTDLRIRVPASDWRNGMPEPRRGRFYPSKVLSLDAPPAPMLRVLDTAGDQLELDFNIPIASLQAEASQQEVQLDTPALGKPAQLLGWAGMECAVEGGETDFQDEGRFSRQDEDADPGFYDQPRRVMHVDEICSSRIDAFYRHYLPAAGRVLDLMSSLYSHVSGYDGELVGLGMNRDELSENTALREHCVHDLNETPRTPFEDQSFDGVINTASFEYLVRPDEVLGDLRRILKPGGVLAVTFSNRFFPPKAIRLWTHLHPMERLGWLIQQVRAAGFTDIVTHVEQGLQRNRDDRYADQFPQMDPLFGLVARAP